MGGVYTPNTNPTGSQDFQDYGLDSLSTGVGVGASFDEAWNGFLTASSFIRGSELRKKSLGEFSLDENERLTYGKGGIPKRDAPDTPIISKEEANEKYGIKGHLSFDQDIREGEARLINQYRQDQQKRDYVLSRSDPGVINSAIRLGVGFVATALDPVSVATSLVPVVGEARFAAMAGRIGMKGARVAKGAIEGTVGAAVVEPFAYMQAQTEHADYTAYDSLVNIAFGGVLGAGLQGAGVVLGKFINRQTPETKQAALNGALAAVMENRPVTVGDVFRFETSRRAELTLGSTLGRSAPVTPMTLATSNPARLDAVRPFEQRLALPDAMGRERFFDTRSQADKAYRQLKSEGYKVEAIESGGFRLTKPSALELVDTSFVEKRAAENAIKRMPPAERDGLEIIRTSVTGKDGFAIVKGLSKEQVEAANKNPSYLNNALSYKMAEDVPSRPITPRDGVNQIGEPLTNQLDGGVTPSLIEHNSLEPLDQVIREMLENSKRSMAPDPQLTAQIIKIADRTSKMKEAPTFEAAKTEATQLDTDVNEMLSMYDLSEKDMAEVSAPKDDIDPDSYTKAVKQAFACMVA